MPEMVAHIARAIARTRTVWGLHFPGDRKGTKPMGLDIEMAIAAISELREPTDAILLALAPHMADDSGNLPSRAQMMRALDAVVDAALR